MHNTIIHWLARRHPELTFKLRQAEMPLTPEDFLKQTLLSATSMTTGIAFIVAVLIKTFELPASTALLIPIIFVMLFYFFLHTPDVRLKKENAAINREVIFAGRFLMVELESGISVYDAIKGISKNYPAIGKYTNDIVKHVDLGTSIEDAISQAAEKSPSEDLRKIFWQLLNSIRTGADSAKSLKLVLDQIVKEQQIAIMEYGRKLNPMAMFYMMIAIIIPTLGTTMLIIISMIMGLPIDFPVLLVLVFIIAFIQFMFLSLIRSSRPSVGAA